MNTTELYSDYKTKMQKIADVKYAAAVLQWDQETYLPPKGNEFRGRQLATLSEIAHEQFTTDAMGDLLNELNNKTDLCDSGKINVQLSLEDYTRNKKLPAKFVRQMSEAVTTSYHAWVKARENNAFTVFAQPLRQLIELKKQEADMLGYEQHPYNALMNDYDKGLTVATVDGIFGTLRPQLLTLLQNIKNQPQVDNSFLHQHFDKDAQWKLGMDLLKNMGFDFEAGRQDLSVHPFTTSFNNYDVRVTTRIDENDFGNMAWSCIHEGGHALYEQGLPAAEYGLPLSEYCSLSIHESQSRLWENNVGRGAAYWQHHFPLLKNYFPKQFELISANQFYKGINKVASSLIRTEADELTYHVHGMIRYEIEKLLIEGSISTKDIPAYWNELCQKYLGVTVPDDTRGCLQDIHWSHGSFGYFATYSLGSMYAAQLYATIEKEHSDINQQIAGGDTATILNWVRKNIHQYGRQFNSSELCKKITGEPLNSHYFLEYAKNKFNTIYGG